MPKVAAPNDDPFAAYPAARLEDMTQPMGPLEEGDQALVDATNPLPEGMRLEEGPGGSRIRFMKHESPGQISASVETTYPDGSAKRVASLVNKASLSDATAINAEVAVWPVGSYLGNTTALAHDNQASINGSARALRYNRKEAQAIKLEAAEKMRKAQKHLGETGLRAA